MFVCGGGGGEFGCGCGSVSIKVFGCVANWLHKMLLLKKSVAT